MHKDRKAHKALLVRKVMSAHKAIQALREVRVRSVRKDHKAHKVQSAHRVVKDRKAIQALRV